MKNIALLCFVVLLSVHTFAHIVMAEDVQNAEPRSEFVINGSSTVSNFIFQPDQQKELFDELGFEFELITSSSGRGVLALADGLADVAIISSEFDSIVEKLNSGKEIKIDPNNYEVHEISETKVLFITHPDNPIRKITRAQAKGIFTGAVSDWAELGVPKLGPIKVVTEHPTGGMYATVLSKVTDGEPITENKIVMQNGPQTAIVVSQTPGGFGMLSAATPGDQRRAAKVLEQVDFEAVQGMYFVTKAGQERPEILSLINAVKRKILSEAGT